MIACVTPNAAIDRTLVVPGYAEGGVFRPIDFVVAAGGKGINVARSVHALGGEAVCAGFLGGFTGNYVADLVRTEGLKSRWTFLHLAETRTCMILVDPAASRITVVNEHGPAVDGRDWARLRADVAHLAEDASHVCFCGSLPPGTTPEIFSEVLAQLKAEGARLWVDTSGSGLRAAVQAKVSIKINDEEASGLLGYPVESTDLAAVRVALHAIHAQTDSQVIMTLGAHGAALLSASGCWFAQAPTIEVRSAVGSGDAFLGAYLLAVEQGNPPSICLQRAAGAGAANALTVGGGRFGYDDYLNLCEQVRVSPL